MKYCSSFQRYLFVKFLIEGGIGNFEWEFVGLREISRNYTE
jgi:hypothetical protein